MRNVLIGLVGTMVLASTMAAVGCSDDKKEGTPATTGGTSATGGQKSTGGSGPTGGLPATGGTPTCPSGTPCGGSVVGTWTVQSTCLALSGQLNLSAMGTDCSSGDVTGGSLQVTGTFKANADGTYEDNTTTTGTEQLTLPEACRHVSNTPAIDCVALAGPLASVGFASATCTDGTAGACNCTAVINQTGQIGIVSPLASTSGSYTVTGTTLAINDGIKDWSYSYCVSGSTLTITPVPPSPTVTGTIVLTK